MTKTLAPNADVDIKRYQEGWRRGKPEEDPDKVKRWGFVSARPSEHLICMRGGQVTSSGQGATIFKWPWESVAIVPTTVQRLIFTADQISSEKTGVKVTGIVMYRIAEPLIAFRMLNFSFPERAQEKLATMMEELCVGATRRLVANLTVDECLTRRKDALAHELIRELAPVVSGEGRVEDTTSRGWGLVVDTIEIQDVRVLSSAVFGNMQARFREAQAQQAREAELSRELAVKTNEATTEREVELTRLTSQTELRQQRQLADESGKLEKLKSDARVQEQHLAAERALKHRQLATEREYQLARLNTEQELRRLKQQADEQTAHDELTAKTKLEQATAQAAQTLLIEQVAAQQRLEEERLKAEVHKATLEATAERERHAQRLEAEAQLVALTTARAQVAQAKLSLSEYETKTVEFEVKRRQLLEQLELDHAAQRKAIENTLSPEVIQLAVANQLPELARAFQQQMGEVHVTAVDGANPFGYIAAAIEGVMGLARSAGLKTPGSTQPGPLPRD